MKKNVERARFPFRFSKLIICLSILAICLCFAGGGISVYRIVKYGIDDLQQVLQGPFLILVCIFGIVVLTSLLIKSEYSLTKTHFTSSFGVIKSKVEMAKITSIVCDYAQNKIILYTGEEFVVLLLLKNDVERFSKTMTEYASHVEIRYVFADEEKK